MRGEIQFLTADDVIEAHAFVMDALGLDPRPLRSRSLLEGAVHRVQMHCHYGTMHISEMAAMTALSISQAQAFVDGNKRTAYSSLILFCRYNGYDFYGDTFDLAIFLVMNAYASEHSRYCKQFELLQEHDDDPSDIAFSAMAIWLRDSVRRNTWRARKQRRTTSFEDNRHGRQLPLSIGSLLEHDGRGSDR